MTDLMRMSTRRQFLARACAAAIALTGAGAVTARAQSQVRGLFNYIHGTRDAERVFAFYHEVFGIELAPSPFAVGAAAAPESIRPAAQAGSDPLVWDLTNTHGSRFRTVFMRAPDTPFGLELSEFFDIARERSRAQRLGPGRLHADLHCARFRRGGREAQVARGAPVVTLGGAPVTTPAGRAILGA